MSDNKIWVRLRDNSGSFTTNKHKFGGKQNLPQLHRRDDGQIHRAVGNRVLVEIPEKDALKLIAAAKPAKAEKEVVETSTELGEITVEIINEALKLDDYDNLKALVKELKLGPGNVSRVNAIELLKDYVAKNA